MRKSDIKPGTLVMCGPSRYGNADSFAQGSWGYPGIILGYGRFRKAQVGLCGYSVEPFDHSGERVVVLRASGYQEVTEDENGHFLRRDHIMTSTPKQEWELDLITPQRVMLLEAWQMVRAELELINMDVEAYNSKIQGLREQRTQLREADAYTWMTSHPGEFTLKGDNWSGNTTFSVRIPAEAFSAETQAKLDELDKEIESIEAKLSCARNIYIR